MQPGVAPMIPPTPGLEIAFDLMRERMTVQSDQMNAVDTKSSFILTAAGFLTAAIAGLQTLLPTSAAHVPIAWTTGRVVIAGEAMLACFVFGALLISGWQAYVVRVVKIVPEPSELENKYLHAHELDAKGELFTSMVSAYSDNQSMIDKKIRWLEGAFRLFLAEAFLLVIMTVTGLWLQLAGG